MANREAITGTDTYFLALHIGASSRHAAILDQNGNVVVIEDLREPPSVRGKMKYVDLVGDAIRALERLIHRAETDGIGQERIVGGGAVVPASVDPQAGYVRLPPSLPALQQTYLGRDLEQGIEKILGRRIRFWVENDANGACLAEAHFGAGRGVKSFLCVLLCTGLGGGLFLDGGLHHGHTFMAGEIGHMTIHPDGLLCPCGGRGCLETVASGRALLRAARDTESPLARREDLHYLDLIDAARSGDQEILGLFQPMGRYLGVGIANIINIFNPSTVVLTGRLAQAAQFFLPFVEEELRNRVFIGMDCNLVVSAFVEDIEVRAALSTYLHYSERR